MYKPVEPIRCPDCGGIVKVNTDVVLTSYPRWECPKCGAILAPHQNYCPFCSRKESDWITAVGTGTQLFYAEWTEKDNLTPPSKQYTNPNPSISISNLMATTSDPNQNVSVKVEVK